MADNDRTDSIKARIIEVDAVTPSPEQRAAFIHGVLKEYAPNLTTWDMIAGLSSILGALTLSEPALEQVIKPLVVRVHQIHYVHGGDLKSCLERKSKLILPDSVDFTKLKKD